MNAKTITATLCVCFFFFVLLARAEQPQETKQLAQKEKSVAIKKARVPLMKKFQLFSIVFLWRALADTRQQGSLSLNYLFSPEAMIVNPKVAIVKGVDIADIKDPTQYKFSKIEFRKQRTPRGEVRIGEIPIQLNEVVIFKTYRNCFAMTPVKIIWKTKGISVFYECKDLSRAHLEKPVQSK